MEIETKKPILYFVMCEKYRNPKTGEIEVDKTLIMTNDEDIANKEALSWYGEPECVGEVIVRPVKF